MGLPGTAALNLRVPVIVYTCSPTTIYHAVYYTLHSQGCESKFVDNIATILMLVLVALISSQVGRSILYLCIQAKPAKREARSAHSCRD